MTRIYRAALRLLPDEVRARHGEQMSVVFAELLRDARRRRGVRGVARAAVSELIALLWFIWCERRGAPLPRRIDERMLSWRLEPERTVRMLPSLLQDLRYAARMLARTPGFTLVCVLTMAMAIGANTAIFSIVNGVLLRPLPYPDPDRIVVLGHHTDGGKSLDTTTPGNFYDWQARATAFESMAAFSYTERIFTWNGNAERVLGAISAGSIFDVLGRTAAQGRTFTAAEDGPNAEWIVVLSDGLARRMFGEQSAVGRTLGIGGIVHTVIGVMPPDFTFPDYDAEYWVPARYAAEFRGNRDPIGKQIYLGAPDNRLFPDATVVGVVTDVKLTALDNERAEVVYVPHRLMPTMPGFAFALRTSMDPLSVTGAARAQLRQLDPNVPIVRNRTMDEVIARSVAPARSSMLLVSLFAALALILAVIGVFGVLSYTVNQRTTELGIRLALGASTRNVKMLVLGQGMMPVVAGVLLGLAGAFALTRFMESLLFGVTPTDPATFAAVSVLLAVMAAVASYLPARRATRVDPVAVLRQA